MKIVHDIANLPVGHTQPRGREGNVKTSLIMGGDPQRIDNFSCRIIKSQADRFSPRHRHNFAQFYYVLDGETTFGDATLTAGWLGYMPEGVHYGPQSGPAHTILVLQHGGPSGQGIIGYDQHTEAFEALKKTGVFEKGAYKPNDGGKNQDSYEAIWEWIRQRPMQYPQPQYSGPINIDTNAIAWAPLEGAAGVEKKTLGTFTNCGYGALKYRLAPDARLNARGRRMYFVIEGSGSVSGNGDDTYERLTAIYLDETETATFHANERTEILALEMPTVAQIGLPPQVH